MIFLKKVISRNLNQWPTYILYLWPLFFTSVVSAIFYPGAMSYDTLHALRGARSGVTDSMWPPMVSYVWRVVDYFSTNPSAMHFLQNFVLLLSIFSIVRILTKRTFYSIFFLILFLSIPVVLGTLAVIWKDVLMAAFFMAAFWAVLLAKHEALSWRFVGLSILAILIIFLGTCSRHNAITGAVPIIFYWTFVIALRIGLESIKKIIFVTIVGISLTFGLFFLKTRLDIYSLPGFERIPSSSTEFIRTVRILDIAGASECVGSNLFGDISPGLAVADIQNIYDPKHINLSKGLFERVPVDSRIDELWVKTAKEHPVCIFYNKFELTKYMLGANTGAQFLITAPSIDQNEFGYKFSESIVRDKAFAYIIRASDFQIYKPWLLYFASSSGFLLICYVGLLNFELFTIFTSGIFYFAGLVMFGNAADARLPFYSTSALLCFLFLILIDLKARYLSSLYRRIFKIG